MCPYELKIHAESCKTAKYLNITLSSRLLLPIQHKMAHVSGLSTVMAKSVKKKKQLKMVIFWVAATCSLVEFTNIS